MDKEGIGNRFRFKLEEVLVIVASTALALGSLNSRDPYIVISMLVISGIAFVALCFWHEGNPKWRMIVALGLLLVLAFVGWRDLRHVSPAIPSIQQKSKDDVCTNIVGGNNVTVKCTETKNVKDKP
jgi:membrane protein implicated in regulation of membrane protease activity